MCVCVCVGGGVGFSGMPFLKISLEASSLVGKNKLH